MLEPCLLVLTNLTDVKQNLKVNLTCISLMTVDAEYFFNCYPDICVLSFENTLLRSVPEVLIGLFFRLMFSVFSAIDITISNSNCTKQL